MQKRIIISITLSILIILISLGIISTISVNDSIQRSLESRLTLANIIGKYIDYMLESNIRRLQDISISGRIDFEDEDWDPEKKAIKTAYEYSIFTDRIFLLDIYGNVVLTYPHQEGGNINLLSIPYVSMTLSDKRPYISDIYTLEPTQRKVIFALVPLKNKNGDFIGVAGGEINPTNYLFTQVLKSVPADVSTVIELVDSHGIIISSNKQERILTCSDHNMFLGNLIAEKKSSVGVCHRCHTEEERHEEKTRDILAFAPLSMASWGITIREPQEIVFAPSTLLKKGFFSLSLIAIGTALLLAIGLSRSIVKPLKALTEAARRIGKGNLSEPIEAVGKDEVGMLAQGFDRMRVQLAESHASIQRQNLELEQRVMERTKDLAESREKLSVLLRRVITAEEEERKRIARELHDDTSQSLNAILMSLDAFQQSLEKNKDVPQKLKRLREQCVLSLQGIHTLIKDLRPPILDDLGFDSAVRWILERHLGGKGIDYTLDIEGSCDQLEKRPERALDCSQMELLLFRVIQEAVINIAKHAQAKNVFIQMCFCESFVEIEIEDDGKGFDVQNISRSVMSGDRHGGFGILGMQERVALMDGKMTLCSQPGKGTQLTVFVPV